MKNFFSSSTFFGNKNSNSQNDSKASENKSFRSQIFGSPLNKQQRRNTPVDLSPILISNAAKCLSEAIQEIISDISSLSGENLTGYRNLIEILEDDSVFENSEDILHNRGIGCIKILIENLTHNKFIEICNQVSLPTVLIHSLRIIRMFILKFEKVKTFANLNEDFSGNIITFKSSYRICQILSQLCTSSQTIENIRQSLVKLITFPLGSITKSGLHFQIHTSEVLETISRTGFTSQQVWFLHGVQLINHMVKQLSDLTSISQNEDDADRLRESFFDDLLRGIEAEDEGMWEVGIKCIIYVLKASPKDVTTFFTDFDTFEGPKLFKHILKYTSPSRFQSTLDAIISIIYDPQVSSENKFSYVPSINQLLMEFLLETLKINEPITSQDNFERFWQISLSIMDNANAIREKDFVIQSFAYSLITMYSFETNMCITIEETTHFIPLLILSIPSVNNSDILSAILTLLNFICQCVEGSSCQPITALCSVTSAILKKVFNEEGSIVEDNLNQLHSIFFSIENIIRNNPKFSIILMECGLLKQVICLSFDEIIKKINTNSIISDNVKNLFIRIVKLMQILGYYGNDIANIYSESGIFSSLERIFQSDLVDLEVAKHILLFIHFMAKIDSSRLEIYMKIMILSIQTFTPYNRKVYNTFDTLSKILIEVNVSAKLCLELCLIEVSTSILHQMKNIFLTSFDESEIEVYISCLSSILRTTSLEIFVLDNSEVKESNLEILMEIYAKTLVETGIFDSKSYQVGTKLLFQFIRGFSKDFKILSPSLPMLLLNVLFEIADKNNMKGEICDELIQTFIPDLDSLMILNESGFTAKLISHFFSTFSPENFSQENKILQLVKCLVKNNINIEIFLVYLIYILRPVLIKDDFRLIYPWESFDGKLDQQSIISWSAIEHLEEIGKDELNSIPFLRLQNEPTLFKHSSYLNIDFKENQAKDFLNSFSCTFWFRINEFTTIKDTNHVLPLFSICPLNSDLSLFEIYLDISDKIIHATTLKKDHQILQYHYKAPFFQSNQWNLLVINVRRNKRFQTTSNRNFKNIYLNGLEAIPISSELISLDSSFISGPISIRIGKVDVYDPLDPMSQLDDIDTAMKKIKAIDKWDLGPINFFDEILFQEQITFIFIHGPKYIGSFQGVEVIEQNYSTLSTNMLHKGNQYQNYSEFFLDLLGLSGLEEFLEPKIEPYNKNSFVYEYPSLPNLVASYNSRNFIRLKSKLQYSDAKPLNEIDETNEVAEYKISPSTIVLKNNINNDCTSVLAILKNSWYISNSTSFSDCISALGSLDILLPLVQAASTENQIILVLKIISNSVKNNISCLRYMQSEGYRELAFLLSIKPRNLLTIQVIDAIYSICLDYSHSKEQPSFHSFLLIDATAFYELILNHNVWDLNCFESTQKVVEIIKLLSSNIKYRLLNIKRLSCLGTSHWLFNLVLYHINNLMDNNPNRSSTIKCSSVWRLKCPSPVEMAEYRDFEDSFLKDSLSIVHKLINSNIQFKDLQFIAMVVEYTFSDLPHSVNRSNDYKNDLSSSIKADLAKLIFCNLKPSDDEQDDINFKQMLPIEVLRIHVFRLIFTIYDTFLEDLRKNSRRTNFDTGRKNSISYTIDPIAQQYFREVFSVKWFLNVLDNSYEVASKSHCLRLLGLFLQKDSLFLKQFIEIDGFKALNSILLGSNPLELPVLLPLLAIFFNLPIPFLLHPIQINSIENFVNTFELVDPIIEEPYLSSQTLPLLSIFLESMSLALSKKQNTAELFNDILFGVLFFCLEKSESSKKLFQMKQVIELVVNSILTFTNAYISYGPNILNDSLDLNDSVFEDYFRFSDDESISEAGPNLTASSSSTNHSPAYKVVSTSLKDSDEPQYSPLVFKYSIECKKMVELISIVFNQSITEFSNPMVLYHFFLSYPKSFAKYFEYGYQKLIFDIFQNCVRDFQLSLDHRFMLNISNILSCLIPLINSHILHEQVSLQVFKLIMDILPNLIRKYESEIDDSTKSKMLLVINEYESLAHYLIFSLVDSSSSEYKSKGSSDALLLEYLNQISLNLPILFNSLEIDNNESSSSPPKFNLRSNPDEKIPTTGSLVFEAIQGLGFKKSVSFTLPQIKAERNRISQYFLLYLLSLTFGFSLDDSSKLRIESTKILSYLAVHKTDQIESIFQQFSPSRSKKMTSSNIIENEFIDPEIDIFKDGISKLIPNSGTKFDQMLQDNLIENSIEENRYADFSFWVSNHESKCNEILAQIDNFLSSSIKYSNIVTDEISSYLKIGDFSDSYNKYRYSYSGHSIKIIVKNLHSHSLYKSEEHIKERDELERQVQDWKNFGIANLTRGAYRWRKVWLQLQTSPLWGYMPREKIDAKADEFLGDKKYFYGKSSKIDVNKDNSVATKDFKKSWYLDPSEGPERIRKKLLQDFSVPLSALNSFKQKKDKSGTYFERDSSGSSDRIRTFSKDTDTISIMSDATSRDGSNNEGDIESFLKSMAKKGVIKKLVSNDEIDGQDDLSNSINLSNLESEFNDPELLDIMDAQNESYDGFVTETLEEVEKNGTPADLLNKMNGQIQETEYISQSSEDIFLDNDTTTMNDKKGFEPANSSNSRDHAGISKQDEIQFSTLDSKSQILKEVILGLIGKDEWNIRYVYNVNRIFGLEAQSAMLILSPKNIHILNGFFLNKETRQIDWNPTSHMFAKPETPNTNSPIVRNIDSDLSVLLLAVWKDILTSDYSYCRIPLNEVYSFFRRRHNLKYTAMEITDIKGFSIFYSCDSKNMMMMETSDQTYHSIRKKNNILLRIASSENEEILVKLLESNLPASIFDKVIGQKNLKLLLGVSNVYNKLVSLFVSRVSKIWQYGELSNFEYLMHINAAAGRSFQDLTQYPIFPWILADYSSKSLDLSDPNTFRDLSKPMGAIGEKRLRQYIERYQNMDEFYKEGIEGSSPPFFYGTHYSCAGYVLHYLVRLQPFADMSISLQGGSFDKPDRLFLSIEQSWKSASQDNFQDVRELIPEFFYLPEFLSNLNDFNLGVTQKDQIVQDVALPPWANNDPKEFIRLHRAALESTYVSENLHNWIDLIFGFKQRGKEALIAKNVFIHITYEDEVDIDAISDPVLKSSTISQINNFGQTPTRIFKRTHPKKIVPKLLRKVGESVIVENNGVYWHSHLSPPLSIIGMPETSFLSKISFSQAIYPGNLKGLPVGDMRLLYRDKIIASPLVSCIAPPSYRFMIKPSEVICGLTVQSIQTIVGSRTSDFEKELTIHENLHLKMITCLTTSKKGDLLVTGGDDFTIRLWKIQQSTNLKRNFQHICTFSGHKGSITCIDISTNFSIVVSGSSDQWVILWDIRTFQMIRILPNQNDRVISVSINQINGNIASLTESTLRLYNLNGELISYVEFLKLKSNTYEYSINIYPATMVLAVPSGDWQNGISLVTGHEDGQILLWRTDLNTKERETSLSHTSISKGYNTLTNFSTVKSLKIAYSPTKVHSASITCLKLASTVVSRSNHIVSKSNEDSKSLDLLVGDADGYISRWSPTKLDQLPISELTNLI